MSDNNNDDDDDDLTRALQSARYNDMVHVSINNGDDDDEEGALRDMALVASLDQVHGGIQWNPLNDKLLLERHLWTKRWIFPMLNDHRRNHLYDKAIQRACRHVVQRFLNNDNNNNNNNNTLHGLDIGTGTGLLAMMSAKYLEQEIQNYNNKNKITTTTNNVHITSLEMSGAMSKIAKQTVASNPKYQTCITILEQHSCQHTNKTSTTTTSPKYHLCTSELLESGLLAEGWLAAIRDAWERQLLHPHAIVVPQRARVYAQVVQGDCLTRYYFMGPQDYPMNGDDQRVLRFRVTAPPSTTEEEETLPWLCGGSSGMGVVVDPVMQGIQIPIHAHALLEKGGGDGSGNNKKNDDDDDDMMKMNNSMNIRPLSEPTLVLEFDVTSKDRIPPKEGQTRTTTFVPTASGLAQGILFWWELDLYDGHDGDDDHDGENQGLTYSTCPPYNDKNNKTQDSSSSNWQDHWHQCLFVFMKPKAQCTSLIQGKAATMVVKHSDTQIFFHVEADDENENDDSNNNDNENHNRNNKKAKYSLMERTNTDDNNIPHQMMLISPERCWQLNDKERLDKLQQGIKAVLDSQGMMAPVLDLSDFSLCGIMAALLGAKHVTALVANTNNSDLAMTTARIAQLGNGLPLPATNQEEEPNHFQMVQCHAEHLSLEVLGGKAAQIVVAEPYTEVLEGWPLLQALNYFYLLRGLKRRGMVSSSTTKAFRSIPSYASIQVCGLQSFEIASAYQKCENPLLLQGCFDHTFVNKHHPFSKRSWNLPMWQYHHETLTEAFEIGRIDYDKCEIMKMIPTEEEESNKELLIRCPFTRAGTCHGIVLWLDYGVVAAAAGVAPPSDDEVVANDTNHKNHSHSECDNTNNTIITTWSTRGRLYRQLVQLLDTPVVIEPQDVVGNHKVKTLGCKLVLGGDDDDACKDFSLKIHVYDDDDNAQP